MAGTPEISLVGETRRHLDAAAANIGDIWRHEGLKKLAENGLFVAGSHPLGRWALSQTVNINEDPLLRTQIGNLDLRFPVGVAPGWDKRGITILGWQALGAGHHTSGGVTLRPQFGNEMPRLRTFDNFIGDHGTAVSLNALGFNSPGVQIVRQNIERQRELGEIDMPAIAQITLNKEMYLPQNIDRAPEEIAQAIRIIVPVVEPLV